MGPKLGAYLNCCPAAANSYQFTWEQECNKRKWNKLLESYSHRNNGGPPKTGWAMQVGESGSTDSYFVNIQFCPFCGQKVDIGTAWRE